MSRNALSTLKIVGYVLLGIVIVSYSLFQGWKIIVGPQIDVYSPENATTYSQALIEVSGRARNVSYINLDDRPIFTDKDGYFKEKLLLSPGLNIIKLDATDKFKTYKERKLQVILKEY
jgi:hypothetical protein